MIPLHLLHGNTKMNGIASRWELELTQRYKVELPDICCQPDLGDPDTELALRVRRDSDAPGHGGWVSIPSRVTRLS